MNEQKRINFGFIPHKTVEILDRWKVKFGESTYTKTLTKALIKLEESVELAQQYKKERDDLNRKLEHFKDSLYRIEQGKIAEKNLLKQL